MKNFMIIFFAVIPAIVVIVTALFTALNYQAAENFIHGLP